MANKPPRKSAKNNRKSSGRPSGSSRSSEPPRPERSGKNRKPFGGRPSDDRRNAKARRKTVKSSAKAPENRRRLPLGLSGRDDEEMLSEFSDDTNDFYVDEQRERKLRARKASAEKKERKKAEKRKLLSPLQRRLIRILSYGAIVTVVLIIGVVLSLTVLFKTQAYEVTGSTKYSESELIDTCGIDKGQNIFLAPKRPAEKRLKNQYPYIEDVDVSFKIPDTIRISVIEAVEGYMVKLSDSEYLVISTKGRILDKAADKNAYDLPIFIGPKPVSGELGDYVSYEDETVLDMIESITQTFADNGYQGITEIDATNTANISFTYDNRIKVKLGIPEDLDYKIRTAMTIINENLDKNNTGTLQGVLDVSRCNTTKRSYFNEQSIAPTQAPSQDPSQPATEAAGSGGGEYTWTPDDGSGGEDIDLGYDYYDEDGYGHYW